MRHNTQVYIWRIRILYNQFIHTIKYISPHGQKRRKKNFLKISTESVCEHALFSPRWGVLDCILEMALKRTLLITGASGFLGQHLVKLAHERNLLNVTKLVLFDRVPFTKTLGTFFSFISVLVPFDMCTGGAVGGGGGGVWHDVVSFQVNLWRNGDILEQ